MPVALRPVTSSFVAAVGYDLASRTLAVEFKNGKRVDYQDVSPEVASDFEKADSPGKFFGAQIRGKYAIAEQAAEETEGATPD